jgi:hypothetical protein
MDAVTTEDRGLPAVRRQGSVDSARGEENLDLSLLPLEKYASLSGALARGEPRDAALARHGLTAGAFEILASAWVQRFQREPQLLERFKELAKSNIAAGKLGDGKS